MNDGWREKIEHEVGVHENMKVFLMPPLPNKHPATGFHIKPHARNNPTTGGVHARFEKFKDRLNLFFVRFLPLLGNKGCSEPH